MYCVTPPTTVTFGCASYLHTGVCWSGMYIKLYSKMAVQDLADVFSFDDVTEIASIAVSMQRMSPTLNT